MKLYFNGCSHTYGDDLSNPLNDSWPAIIAKKTNNEFINDSMSGGTNDRILYQTIKNANCFDKFYIAWTYTARFTRYRSDNNYPINFNPQLRHDMFGHDKSFTIYGEYHYKYWHNELYNFKLWLQNILLIQRFIESINKPYIMINATDNLIEKWCSSREKFIDSIKELVCFDIMNNDQLFAEHEEIQNLLTQINFTYFIGWNDWYITKLHSDYALGPTGHLLSEGHMAIANYILENDRTQRVDS